MNKNLARLAACTTLMLSGVAHAQSSTTLTSPGSTLTFSSSLQDAFTSGQVTLSPDSNPVIVTALPVDGSTGSHAPLTLSSLTFNPTSGLVYGNLQSGGSINLSQLTGFTIPSIVLISTPGDLTVSSLILEQGMPTLNGLVVSSPTVPEPGTWLMMSLGLAGLGWARVRTSRR
jgi:hypothetical protein